MRQFIGDRVIFDAECDGASFADSIVNPLALSPVLRGIMFGSAALLLCLILATAAILIRHRKSSAFKSAQPFFLLITAAGCALSVCAIYAGGLDHTGRAPDKTVPAGESGRYPELDAACGVQIWCAILGASLMYAPLVAKLLRVSKVMINPSMRRVKLPPHKFYAAIGGVVLLDVLLLAAWQATSPPFYRVHVHPPLTAADVETWHGSCLLLPPGNAGLAATLFGKQLAVFLFGLWLCHKARHLDNAYSDAKATSFVLAGQLERTVAGLIVLLMLHPVSPNGSPAGFLLVKWLLLASGPVAILFFIFASRLSMLYDERVGVPIHSVRAARSGSFEPTSRVGTNSRQPSVPGIGDMSKHVSSRASSAMDFLHAIGSGAMPRIFPRLEAEHNVDVAEAPKGDASTLACPERKRLGERFMLAAHNAKLNDSLAIRCAEMEDELGVTRAELINLNEEMDDMRDDMSQLRERNHNLQVQLSEMKKSNRFSFSTRSARKGQNASIRSVNAKSLRSEQRHEGDSERLTPAASPQGKKRMGPNSTPVDKKKSVMIKNP
jgi:hypothetical protein